MADDRVGAASVGKSVRSLLEVLRSLHREVEVLFGRAGLGPASPLWRVATETRVEKLLSRLTGNDLLGADASPIRALIRLLGLTDEASVREIRGQLGELFEQVARLREREVALAGGLSQLRTRASRFEESLAGLARVQGRWSARLRNQESKSDRVERSAGRRDDHVARLIRDTASQRIELDKLIRNMEEQKAKRASDVQEQLDVSASAAIDARVNAIERRLEDFRKTQKTGTQSVIDSLEAMRERLAKLESRATEMSREARAKTGRLDALARHMAAVDGRLSTAIGRREGKTLVAGAEQPDSIAAMIGTT